MNAKDDEERQRSLELLNATHSFPCEFTIKVIGTADDEFVGRVVKTVEAAISMGVPYKTRSTPNGKHVSVTLEPYLSRAEDVLAIYDKIKSVPGVVMTL